MIDEKNTYQIPCPNCGKNRFLKMMPLTNTFCKSCRNKISASKRIYRANKIGLTFGQLKVISFAEKTNGRVYWNCKCSCGVTKKIDTCHLHSHGTVSCGCIHRKQNGLCKTHGYKSWASMIDRCYKKHLSHYARYGGRGIKVCNRWRNSFLNFLEDMGPRPNGTSLDRIDANKGYSKKNCRWATLEQQSINRRSTRIITAFGKTQTAIEWAKEKAINRKTLLLRIDNGYTPEEALTLEVSWRKKSEKQKIPQP